ncbi:hypothetical protein ACFQ3L_02495 [Lacticaseibacillus jixianensis]|uniref:HTH cro/C1-type domain-containing protein n=1 Tax=Lacticaseibacillus jixianensis TaxID=2486012 RepID=A0ABW4B8G0_9LACO|nr:Rgg/GadR/MutR family transcriptional regulator [Lacticaseibacillus jixianensis]
MSQQFGVTAKAIRQSKHLTLQNVADEQLSVSALSRFENGQADLTVTKFAHLLERLWTTPEEFVFRYLQDKNTFDLNGYLSMGNMLMRFFPQGKQFTGDAGHSTAEQIRAKFNQALPALDAQIASSHDPIKRFARPLWELLREEMVDTGNNDFHFPQPHPEYTTGIRQYLMALDDWGEFDIYMFTGFMPGFAPKVEKQLFQLAMTRAVKYQDFRSTRELIFRVLENQFNLCMAWCDYAAAKECLTEYENQLKSSTNANNNINYLFNRGWYRLRTDKVTAGTEDCEHALTVTKFLKLTDEDHDLSELYHFIQTHNGKDDWRRAAIFID